jgi:chromosome segregation protein
LFIKELIIHGFKAFADKTSIKFDEGIGGLIGPNGCGKSNVIDAIKWVIGEQKVSEMRGSKMEDVIFHGSEDKPKSNYAEVELIIENSNQLIAIDFKEISIKRRLYRSGESDYLINGGSCRLKDIQNLFLDTGIGTSTYSVIEQGKIDQILSKNPADRRFIFEEASSISKYRMRKKEYEQRIEKTRVNLSWVNDNVKGLERQQKQLKSQAESSEQYYVLQEKLKSEEINNFLYELVRERNKKDSSNKRITSLQDSISSQNQQIEDIDNKIKKYIDNIKNRQEDVGSLEKKQVELSTHASSLERQMYLFSDKKSSLQQTLELRQKDQQHFQDENIKIKENIVVIEQDILKFNKKCNENKVFLDENGKRSKVLNDKISKYNSDVTIIKKRVIEIKKETTSLNNDHLVVVEELITEIDSLKSSLSDTKKIAEENKKSINSYRKILTEQIDSLVKSKSEEDLQVEVNELLAKDAGSLKKYVKDILPQIFQIKTSGNQYLNSLNQFVKTKDPFYDLIFSTEGSYAKKEKIDNLLISLRDELEQCDKKLEYFNEELEKCQNEIGRLQQSTAEFEIENAGLEQSIEHLKRNNEEKISIINQNSTRLVASENEISKLKEELKKCINEIDAIGGQVKNVTTENENMSKKLSKYSSTLSSDNSNLTKQQEKKSKILDQISENERKIFNLEGDIRVVDSKIESLYQICKDQHSEDLTVYEKEIVNKDFNPAQIKSNISDYRQKMQEIGSINPLAKAEYDSISERLEDLYKQRKDINISMEDLIKVAKEIDIKSEEMFLHTFSIIKTNFNKVFRTLFEGGRADIILQDPKKPLTTGIDINIHPPGKKMQNITLFSGGEKSMIAIALMFSIFLVKPAPICLLDEVDAAMDAANIKRLSRMFNDFREKTQFIIISHNQKTVSIIDYVYGITMNNGVTKVLSLKF